MRGKRKAWDQLSPAYQTRLRRNGIGPEEHAAGASLHKARGQTSRESENTRRRERRAQLRAFRRWAKRHAEVYGVDEDDAYEWLRDSDGDEADATILLQRELEQQYMSEHDEGDYSKWETDRDHNAPEWMYWYHGAWS